jgi:hypothetical protein
MANGFPTRVVPKQVLFALFFIIAIFAGCGGGSTAGMVAPNPTPTPIPTGTPTPAPSTGLLVKVGSATVPVGGIFQYQLLLTEPKPIGVASTRPQLPSGPTGPIRGVAVNDASGQAIGIAVVNGSNVTVSIQSPTASLGTNVDYPLLILTMPVTSTASSPISVSMDPSSIFLFGNTPYTIQENVAGTLTIGGTISITDVIPGGGAIKDGDTISVFGIGFDANTKIQVNNTGPATTQTFVPPDHIDVKISPCVLESNPCVPAPTLQLDGDRIRAIKGNETVEYFSYDRTEDVAGASGNPLVTLVHPMFSEQHFLSGSFAYSAAGTVFTGIALENTATVDATMRVDLLDSAGNVLASTASFVLPARRKMVRDIADLFSSVPVNTAKVRASVTTGPAVRVLGFSGDTSKGTASPLVVTGQ